MWGVNFRNHLNDSVCTRPQWPLTASSSQIVSCKGRGVVLVHLQKARFLQKASAGRGDLCGKVAQENDGLRRKVMRQRIIYAERLCKQFQTVALSLGVLIVLIMLHIVAQAL